MPLFDVPMESKETAVPPVVMDRPETDIADEEKTVKAPGAILCKACGHAITREQERFSMQGAHRHTFANPHGLVFEIGCFQNAPGCIVEGSLTADFSWFAGFKWRIALCGACLIHLGWQFVSGGGRFSGLILDRLVRRMH